MADLEHRREAGRLAKEAASYEGLPTNHHVQLGQLAQVHALLYVGDVIGDLRITAPPPARGSAG